MAWISLTKCCPDNAIFNDPPRTCVSHRKDQPQLIIAAFYHSIEVEKSEIPRNSGFERCRISRVIFTSATLLRDCLRDSRKTDFGEHSRFRVLLDRSPGFRHAPPSLA